jgi:hypothetical protein
MVASAFVGAQHIAPFPQKVHPPQMYKLNPSARASEASPLHISASLPPRPKFTPFSAINIRSSGSNTKSNPLDDFWSPYNEELLDENHLSTAKYSFLFAIPSDRACAQVASRSTPFGGSRHSRSNPLGGPLRCSPSTPARSPSSQGPTAPASPPCSFA